MAPTTQNKPGVLKRLTERAKKIARRLGPHPARRQDGYPRTGTGKRQGARLARQRSEWMLDFSASERCLAAIARRLA